MIVALVLLFCCVVMLAARQSSAPDREWEDVRAVVAVERLQEWAHIRSGSRKAITETERYIRDMSENEFVALVSKSLKNVKMEDEAQVIENQYETHRKEASTLLPEWDVTYRKN